MARRTLVDISKETGFAVSTISSVLNGRSDCYASQETRKAILDAVERMGYRPNYFANALRAKASKIIGIIGSFRASELQSWQYAGLQQELRKKGYFVVLMDLATGVSKAFSEFDTMNADGVIAFYDRDDQKAIEKVTSALPSVAVASREIPGVCTIVIDKKAAVESLTRHLIGLGHRKILFVAHKLSQSRSKYEGYAVAMKDAGLGSEIHAIESPQITLGSHLVVTDNMESFRNATAVVTTGDHLAVEVISGLRRAGINVPECMSVVGFGDDSSAVFSSPLITTAHVPRLELGAMAAEMLLNLIAGKKVRNRRIVPEIVKRESDAEPPTLLASGRPADLRRLKGVVGIS